MWFNPLSRGHWLANQQSVSLMITQPAEREAVVLKENALLVSKVRSHNKQTGPRPKGGDGDSSN